MITAATKADPTIRRQVMVSARDLLGRDPRTPIRSITRRAGVSRATFYRHFGSRRALLEAVLIEPPASARQRVLEAAAELLGRGGLHAFSTEELATSAGVSRATVYRLFPSKAALFTALMRAYSPFESMIDVLERSGENAPAEVLPAVGRAMAVGGYPRLGILRHLILQASAGDPDALSGLQPLLDQVVGRLAAYMAGQMKAGRLRPMHPLLALQAVIGPIAFHLLTRVVTERMMGMRIPVGDAAEELVRGTLSGLAPPVTDR